MTESALAPLTAGLEKGQSYLFHYIMAYPAGFDPLQRELIMRPAKHAVGVTMRGDGSASLFEFSEGEYVIESGRFGQFWVEHAREWIDTMCKFYELHAYRIERLQNQEVVATGPRPLA